MATITIELPDTIPQDSEEMQSLPRFILEEVALAGYRQVALSQRQVGEILGMNFWETEAFLKEHKAYLHYDMADFEHDLQTFERVRQKHRPGVN